MALPLLASIDDFEEWLGRSLEPAELTRAAVALRMASTLIRSYKGVTYLETDSDELVDPLPDEVWTAALLVTTRLFTQPNDGVSQETTGPFSVSYRSAALYLTGSEKALLDGATNTLTSVRVIAPTFPMDASEWDQLIESDTA